MLYVSSCMYLHLKYFLITFQKILKKYCLTPYVVNILAITNLQKGKFVPVHAMKAYKGNRGMALLILNFVAGWSRVVNITPQSH